VDDHANTPVRTNVPQRDEPSRGDRIAKVIARAGLCSRREAEAWIAGGRVTLNGAVITSPAINVADTDRITVDGKSLPARERTRLFLYHKPRGLMTTHADPQGRPTIFAALPKDLPRLVSVGRLDLNTEGLLLLTNDGALARVLELPQTGWLRRYRVRAHGRVTQEQLDHLRDGATIEGVHYGPIEALLERVQGSNVWLTFAIREGKNREVKNVLASLDLGVARLIRVSFGPFQLGELADGAVEEVKTRTLRDQLGERLAKLAGSDFTPATLAMPIEPVGRSKGGFRKRPGTGTPATTRGRDERKPEREGRKPGRDGPKQARDADGRKPDGPQPERPARAGRRPAPDRRRKRKH
jgi:23S rRNA pseudouridine2605 synthase